MRLFNAATSQLTDDCTRNSQQAFSLSEERIEAELSERIRPPRFGGRLTALKPYSNHTHSGGKQPKSAEQRLECILGALVDYHRIEGQSYSGICPVCFGSEKKLTITLLPKGIILATCHSGSACSFAEIQEELQKCGVSKSDWFPSPGEHRSEALQIVQPRSALQPANPTWAKRATKYAKARTKDRLSALAKSLGVREPALIALGVGWSKKWQAYTFPERNFRGEVIGIATRKLNGKKKFILGGKRGLYLPEGWEKHDGPVFLVEGASDTAVMVDNGISVIGRPSNTGGVSHLKELLKQERREIIVVGENDKKPDGSHPGLEGAQKVATKLATSLARSISLVIPSQGQKDIRSWFTSTSLGWRTKFIKHVNDHKTCITHAPQSGYRPQWKSWADFALEDCRPEWLIEGIMVVREPAIIGGPVKSLKTSISLDLAISLATATPFLGKFKVPKKRRVLIVSGESGKATIQRALRTIAAEREVTPTEDLGLDFTLPRLDNQEHVESLVKLLKQKQAEVVILDPLYLCGMPAEYAANVAGMGAFLRDVTERLVAEGILPILIHHGIKSTFSKREPLDLTDLAGAGVAEHMRQWLLVNRRKEYDTETGVHTLNLVYGGSNGASGTLIVTVQEGKQDIDFSGRSWKVDVKKLSDYKVVQRQLKAKKKDAVTEERAVRILRHLQGTAGLSANQLHVQLGIKPNLVKEALDQLLESDQVRVETAKRGSNICQVYFPNAGVTESESEAD